MNILDEFNEWNSEQNETMTNPTFPFQQEEARDIHKCLECMGSMADVLRIRRIWKERRDFEFEGWYSLYREEFNQWLEETV